MKAYMVMYCDCIYESGYHTVDTFTNPKDAAKLMNSLKSEDFTETLMVLSLNSFHLETSYDSIKNEMDKWSIDSVGEYFSTMGHRRIDELSRTPHNAFRIKIINIQ